jgi:HK97 family phage prohead protease
MKADFSGYASKSGLKCSDGRTILAHAFKEQDGAKVPLVWQHMHNEPENVLGHAYLENREDGVYAYGFFNDEPQAQVAKGLVKHGDIEALSIYANRLVQKGGDVLHGSIKEVSLVLAGANPGAFIDNVNIAHSDGYEEVDDEAIIYTGLSLEHQDNTNPQGDNVATPTNGPERTVKDVFDSMSEEQQNVVYYMIGEALSGADSMAQSDEDAEEETLSHEEETNVDNDEVDTEDHIQHNQEGTSMSRNVFEQNGSTQESATLSHSQLQEIVADAQKSGSFKEAFLAHAVTYGIDNIDILFPDAKNVSNTPDWVKRRTEWVSSVIGGTRKSPFSRIKSMSADITADEARAKGYIKGNLKKEEFFAISRRVTTPTTIYKKQKLDRDDIIDITDLDVVAWLKSEMRLMLDEEIARAILIGDGREVDDEDKINETNIRPIAWDDEFYAHPVTIDANLSGDAIVEAILRSRSNYKGTGTPTFYTTEAVLTDLLLVKDKMGRRLYSTEGELAAALRVSSIVAVEVMETVSDLIGIVVNLADYTVGADNGGNVSMFDDFDIDYNQYKYLIEGRMSGTLTKPKSALVVKRDAGYTEVVPTAPTFVKSTGVVTIPSVTGVTYKNGDTGATLTAGAQTAIDAGASVEIVAVANTGYAFPHNTDADWVFTRNAV